MIITQTPLRISLAGGGTDFPDYFRRQGTAFVSTAIDKYVFVIVKERFDDLIVLNYSDREIVERVDQIGHDLIREAMRITGIERGVEITTLADIPSEGCGLGSSSSITVGLLNAFYAFNGELVTAERLAREAVRIEVEILGRPIGIQDQYIAAYGNLRRFTVAEDGTVDGARIAMSEGDKRRLGEQLMLWYLNSTRNSASILESQKENIGNRLAQLDALRGLVPGVEASLVAGRVNDVGRALHEGWRIKRELADTISNDGIDRLYETAREAGALGGKVVGAGGGGFLLLCCPRECQARLREVFAGYRELPFGLERDGSKVIFNALRYSTK